jgi:hypothetical protein
MAANLRTINDAIMALAGHLIGDTFTPVQASGDIGSTTVEVLHTVTAGHTLRITDAYLSTQSVASGKYARLYVRTSAPADVIDIIRINGSSLYLVTTSNRVFPRPFLALAGQQVCIQNSGGGFTFGSFSGFEMRDN